MLSKAHVLTALSEALPDALIMWEDEEDGQATAIITLKHAEHYVGLDLAAPGLTVPELVRNIVSALSVPIP